MHHATTMVTLSLGSLCKAEYSWVGRVIFVWKRPRDDLWGKGGSAISTQINMQRVNFKATSITSVPPRTNITSLETQRLNDLNAARSAKLNETQTLTFTWNVTRFNTLCVLTAATNVPFQNNVNAVQTIHISCGDALHVCANVCVCTSTPVNESQAKRKVFSTPSGVHQSHSTPHDFKTKHMHTIYAIKPCLVPSSSPTALQPWPTELQLT